MGICQVTKQMRVGWGGQKLSGKTENYVDFAAETRRREH